MGQHASRAQELILFTNDSSKKIQEIQVTWFMDKVQVRVSNLSSFYL